MWGLSGCVRNALEAGLARRNSGSFPGYSELIDRLVQLVVWVILAAIVGVEVWFLIDPAKDAEARIDMLKFLGLVWSGMFLALTAGPMIKNRRYDDLVKRPPITRIVRKSAFRASVFTIFFYMYWLVRMGPT